MRPWSWWMSACFVLAGVGSSYAEAPPVGLADAFPPPEDRGGWTTLLPDSGIPDSAQKAEIRKRAGVDWDKLAKAWDYNAESPGNTGFLVIRRGMIVGEWYRGGDRKTEYNIYSSSKAYTSTAFGLILSDFGADASPGGRILMLDTKVCNAEWLPESLPLPDPRKAEATVRTFLNMTSGLGTEAVPPKRPYEWSLGHVEGSPFAKLKGEPGKVFHYSNAGVSHLVLLFHRASGTDLYPFLKEKLFDPVGIKQIRWQTIGGDGGIGPFNQGYSGIYTVPREHARFCYLALHRGEWDGKRIVPDVYYDFAWKGTKVNPNYGAQWWVYPRWKQAPRDLVMTSGKNHNDGFVLPSKDLIFVRLGDGDQYPKDFEDQLVKRVLASLED
jgi:CubicO group peptidase (beta-lactamase class C family)